LEGRWRWRPASCWHRRGRGTTRRNELGVPYLVYTPRK
jgi:hypothetical protein